MATAFAFDRTMATPAHVTSVTLDYTVKQVHNMVDCDVLNRLMLDA